MVENDPSTSLPKPGGDDTDQAPAPEPVATPKPSAPSSGRFAIYDNVLRQFVGSVGVVDKRPTKAEAKRAVGHDDYEIREV
jgi:hypothetical protein